jgi:hypothetical protein
MTTGEAKHTEGPPLAGLFFWRAMMRVQAIPLTDFIHDDLRMKRNRAIMLDESLARDFESRGLVRIKMAAFVPRKVAPPGNSLAGGEAQPSVASPPAPVSNMTTTPIRGSYVLGLPKHRKHGR